MYTADHFRGTAARRRRLLALFLIGACTVLPASISSAQTLDRIAQTKRIKLGVVSGQPPFAFRDAGGKYGGYAVDLCTIVANEIGKRASAPPIEYVETSLTDAFDAVATGKVDLLCGAVTASLSRRETVDFSEPIFATGTTALLRVNAPLIFQEFFSGERQTLPPRSLEMTPFAVLRLGVRDDTTTETALREAVKKQGYKAEILVFPAHSEGLAALEGGKIDAYFADRALLVDLQAKARRPSDFVIGKRLFTREPYAIALRRGDADFRLLIDRALSRFYATPEFLTLLSRYFGTDAADVRVQVRALSIGE